MNPNEIHVWTGSLEVSAEWVDLWTRCLSADERARAQRIRFDKPRREFLIARSVLRLLLGEYLECDPATLRFRYTPAGKPLLASPAPVDLHFNLSHSHGHALWAFALGREVGVDVEGVRDLVDRDALVDRFFGPQEKLTWQDLDEDQRREAFWLAWTRKEAYVKARGWGFTRGVDAVEVTLVPGQEPALLQVAGEPGEEACWRLLDLPVDPSHRAAVAIRGGQEIVVHRRTWGGHNDPKEQ